MYAYFKFTDLVDENGIDIANVTSQADAIPYLVDLLDEMEQIEIAFDQVKGLVQKEFKAYGLEVQYF